MSPLPTFPARRARVSTRSDRAWRRFRRTSSTPKQHEWVHLSDDGTEATVGITDFAQKELGDIVYVEIAARGRRARADGVVRHHRGGEDGGRSLRAAHRSKCSRSITSCTTSRRSINESPYEDGWIVRMRVDQPGRSRRRCLSADDYRERIVRGSLMPYVQHTAADQRGDAARDRRGAARGSVRVPFRAEHPAAAAARDSARRSRNTTCLRDLAATRRREPSRPARMTSFLGAGIYDGIMPSVVGAILSRSEFYTAYTPYQPEVSQGTLQTIFEFQTHDRAPDRAWISPTLRCTTARPRSPSRAMLHDRRHAAGGGSWLPAALHPRYRAVLDTYVSRPRPRGGRRCRTAPDGRMDLAALAALCATARGVLLLQQPNFFGIVEDVDGNAARARRRCRPSGGRNSWSRSSRCRSACWCRRASTAPPSRSAKDSRSGLPQMFGGPLVGLRGLRPRPTCARSPGAWWARPWTPTAGAATC